MPHVRADGNLQDTRERAVLFAFIRVDAQSSTMPRNGSGEKRQQVRAVSFRRHWNDHKPATWRKEFLIIRR